MVRDAEKISNSSFASRGVVITESRLTMLVSVINSSQNTVSSHSSTAIPPQTINLEIKCFGINLPITKSIKSRNLISNILLPDYCPFGDNSDVNPAVLCPSLRRFIACHWFGFSVAEGSNGEFTAEQGLKIFRNNRGALL